MIGELQSRSGAMRGRKGKVTARPRPNQKNKKKRHLREFAHIQEHTGHNEKTAARSASEKKSDDDMMRIRKESSERKEREETGTIVTKSKLRRTLHKIGEKTRQIQREAS